MQAFIAFFNAVLQGLIQLEIPAGTVAVLGGGLLAAIGVIHWHTLFYTLFFLVVAYSAANLVAMAQGGI